MHFCPINVASKSVDRRFDGGRCALWYPWEWWPWWQVGFEDGRWEAALHWDSNKAVREWLVFFESGSVGKCRHGGQWEGFGVFQRMKRNGNPKIGAIAENSLIELTFFPNSFSRSPLVRALHSFSSEEQYCPRLLAPRCLNSEGPPQP